MEEIQKRLSGTKKIFKFEPNRTKPFFFKFTEQKHSPKFTQEIREVRIKEGMKARFEAFFAGNPAPDIIWAFNGEELKNSQNVQIRVKGSKTTLTLIDCTVDMTGFYLCRATSELGTDTTRAGLTVSSELSYCLVRTDLR